MSPPSPSLNAPRLRAPVFPGEVAGQAEPKTPIDSHTLFNGQVEIEIKHLAQVYRLRQTSLGKLILTK